MGKDKRIILMTHEIPSDWSGSLLDRYKVIIGKKEERGIDSSLKPHLPQASGIFCLLDDPITADVINNAPELKVISNMAVGVDNIDLAACTERRIPVGHTPGVLTEGTADLTLAILLSICRKLPQASDDARAGRWSNWDPIGWLGADLNGATVGIVGMGKIGSAVAQRLNGFDTKIIFSDKSQLPEKEKGLNAKQVDLDELLETSDFICLHVPLNNETKGLIDSQAIRKMKSSAILINAARGAVVDTNALVHALQNKTIRAAALDVTDPEPLPPDHPLYKLENCLITPHIGSATENTRRKMAVIALENLHAGLAGSNLPFCVNPEVYD
jgi:lactate dehydrogenase-like 2-hydroxyacid dehydrogenase